MTISQNEHVDRTPPQTLQDGIEFPVESFDIDRATRIETASTYLWFAIKEGLSAGTIPEDSPFIPQALALNDALNPNWPGEPNWDPAELDAELENPGLQS